MRLSQRAAWLLLLFALPSIAACSRSQPPSPDRIVFVVVDTLRRDYVSSSGGQVHTPHIDRLAERGQVFDDAVSSFHMTSMSMGALFTGHTPSLEAGRPQKTLGWNGRVWCGLARFASRAESDCVPSELRTLGEAMKEADYQTLGVVSNRLLFDPAGFSQGFDHWSELGAPSRPAVRLSYTEKQKRAAARSGAAVNRAVEETLSRRSSDRFFLYVHYMDAHDYVFDYPDAVGRADAAVGGLLAILETLELLDGTAVVFTSDHGELLGGDHPVPPRFRHVGNPSYEDVVRVPLIVSPPLAALGISEPRHPLRGQDVFGLLLRIAGLEPPDSADVDRDELFLSERRWQTYRQGDWKLIRERKGNRALLFDLSADPDERHSLTEAHPERAADFGQRLDELSTRLAPEAVRPTELTDEDRARLRALGYAE